MSACLPGKLLIHRKTSLSPPLLLLARPPAELFAAHDCAWLGAPRIFLDGFGDEPACDESEDACLTFSYPKCRGLQEECESDIKVVCIFVCMRVCILFEKPETCGFETDAGEMELALTSPQCTGHSVLLRWRFRRCGWRYNVVLGFSLSLSFSLARALSC